MPDLRQAYTPPNTGVARPLTAPGESPRRRGRGSGIEASLDCRADPILGNPSSSFDEINAELGVSSSIVVVQRQMRGR
jgi:hypothetical protein